MNVLLSRVQSLLLPLGSLTAVWVSAALCAASAQAQTDVSRPSGTVYTCQTANGTITSDRYIAQCNDREQKQYFREGTASRTVPPTYTAHERAAIEEKKAREQAFEEGRSDIVRRDRQLMRRYSSAAMHQVAREKSLEPVQNAQRISLQRLAALEVDRKPLRLEAEFYKGKKLPPKLQVEFDVVDASEEAIQTAMRVQREEVARINDMYDIELERLKKLWAGAAPGSLGPMRQPTSGAESEAAASAPAAPAATPVGTPAKTPAPAPNPQKTAEAPKTEPVGTPSKVTR
jgi:hypothetical protein